MPGPTSRSPEACDAAGIRALGPGDLADFLDLTATDPVTNVFVEHRARTTNLDPRWMGGRIFGRYADGRLVAACHAAANLVPVCCTDDDARAFARMLLERRVDVATVVGPADAVAVMWDLLAPRWGPGREVRADQPHLVIDRPPAVAPDPLVRRSRPDEIDAVYPASVAMYTEEVGVSPEIGGRDFYRARVQQLIARGWSFARFDEAGRVVFKADVAAASPHAAQIQGVWIAPEHRGTGLAAGCVAAVAEQVLLDVAPVASLYVNAWNTPARRAYQRAGFTETTRFTTVLM